MASLEGKVALVTGASSGIGRATALRLAADGALVGCVDVVPDACEKTAQEIRDAGGTATSHGCDVRDRDAVRAIVDAVAVEHGGLDVVCNIAGVGRFAHTHEQDLEGWERIIAINLTGTFLVAQAALPHLFERGGGAIINTASTAGLIGQPYSAAYCASKGGVVLLSKAMAYEYIKRNVRVNAVAPGGIETPILNDFSQFPEGFDPKLLHKIMTPMGMGQPEEVAAVFAFLASDDARYVTGSVYSIDGGITI